MVTHEHNLGTGRELRSTLVDRRGVCVSGKSVGHVSHAKGPTRRDSRHWLLKTPPDAWTARHAALQLPIPECFALEGYMHCAIRKGHEA